MVHLIVGADNPNCGDLLEQIFRLRHTVFIEEMGWKLPAQNGREVDRFDTPDTLYLAEVDDRGEVISTVRMNLMSGPTLMSEIFPHMCEGGVPKSPQMWELTRGAIARHVRATKHFGNIECATIEAALLWGVTKACGLFGVDLLTKKIRCGLDAHPMGRPRMIDGEPHVAAEFVMNGEVLQRTRALYRVSRPVLAHIHLMPEHGKVAA